MTKRDAVDFAADHALMTWQREERRRTGRRLQPGELEQAHVGGDIRQVVAVRSIDDLVREWPIRRGGSSLERCALYAAKGE